MSAETLDSTNMELLLFLIVVFAGYSLYLGKEALVKEAVKLLGVLVAGMISGYHWGKRSKGE